MWLLVDKIFIGERITLEEYQTGVNYVIENADNGLYENLKQYILNHCLLSSTLIVPLPTLWQEFSKAAHVLNAMCGYLNRFWLLSHHITVFDMAKDLWKQHVFFKHMVHCISILPFEDLINLYQDMDSLHVLEESILQKLEALYAHYKFTLNVLEVISAEAAKFLLISKDFSKRVSTLLYKLMISKHLPSIYKIFQDFLEQKDMQGLTTVFQIVTCVPNTIDKFFEKFIYNLTCRLNLNQLIKAYHEFEHIVSFTMDNISTMRKSLDNAFKDVCGGNIEKDLVVHMDTSLKLKQDPTVGLSLFRYIQDYTLFQQMYIQLMTTRLLKHTFDEEAEMTCIRFFKDHCGFFYVHRMQKMLSEIRPSITYERFTAHVLSHGIWPLEYRIFTPPTEFEVYSQKFERDYKASFPSRKLMWLYHISQGEIISTCFSKPYVFKGSVMGLATLLHFNTHSSLPFTDSLEGLLKLKILRKKEGTKEVELNPEFFHKDDEIDVTLSHSESQRVKKSYGMEVSLVVQCSITRTLKARRKQTNQELFEEVCKLLSKRFQISETMYKKCIDTLIEKEYIRAGEGCYEYVT